MWHYFSSLYGKKIKSLIFSKTKKKIAFGRPFISLISFLELRLNILLIRMRLASKLLESNNLVGNCLVNVNGVFKHKSYLARVNDIIQRKLIVEGLTGDVKKLRFFNKKWRRYVWQKWRKKMKLNKLKRLSIFRFSKKIVLSLNYLEVNYKIQTGIIVKKPELGEILLSYSKKILSSTMLKKVYFLY